MSERLKFIDRCLTGEVLLDEIDDFVDRWHANPDDMELYDYLGMTTEEYSLWVRVPDALAYIVTARHHRRPLTTSVMHAYQDIRLAARANDQSKMNRLLKWLQAQGEII
jgi:hypothetical protein